MVMLGLTIYDIETGGRIHRRIEYGIVNDADGRWRIRLYGADFKLLF